MNITEALVQIAENEIERTSNKEPMPVLYARPVACRGIGYACSYDSNTGQFFLLRKGQPSRVMELSLISLQSEWEVVNADVVRGEWFC